MPCGRAALLAWREPVAGGRSRHSVVTCVPSARRGGALAVPCGRAALLAWREPVAGGRSRHSVVTSVPSARRGGALAVPCGRAALLAWREPVAGGDRAGLCVPCQHGLVAPRSGLHLPPERRRRISTSSDRAARDGLSSTSTASDDIPPMNASSAAPPAAAQPVSVSGLQGEDPTVHVLVECPCICGRHIGAPRRTATSCLSYLLTGPAMTEGRPTTTLR